MISQFTGALANAKMETNEINRRNIILKGNTFNWKLGAMVKCGYVMRMGLYLVYTVQSIYLNTSLNYTFGTLRQLVYIKNLFVKIKTLATARTLGS